MPSCWIQIPRISVKCACLPSPILPILKLDPDFSFVLAVQTQNMNNASAEHFRTYSVDFTDPFPGNTCPIWQAARATSAAPLYLPSITINGVEFVDGGMECNNPTLMHVMIFIYFMLNAHCLFLGSCASSAPSLVTLDALDACYRSALAWHPTLP